MTNLVQTMMVLRMRGVKFTKAGEDPETKRTRFIEMMDFIEPSRDDSPEDQTSHSFTKLQIAKEIWQDMGEPGTITILVQTGDRLNA